MLSQKEESQMDYELLVNLALGLAAMGIFLLVARPKKGMRPLDFVWLGLFCLYLSIMYAVTGLPSAGHLAWDPTINLIPFSDFRDRRYLFLSCMNVLMTVPLGVFLPLVWKKYQRLPATLAAGFFTSLSIEIMQLFCFRSTDIDDLIYNTLGTVLGFLLGKLILGSLWKSCGNAQKRYWWLNAILILLCFFLRDFLYGLPY